MKTLRRLLLVLFCNTCVAGSMDFQVESRMPQGSAWKGSNRLSVKQDAWEFHFAMRQQAGESPLFSRKSACVSWSTGKWGLSLGDHRFRDRLGLFSRGSRSGWPSLQSSMLQLKAGRASTWQQEERGAALSVTRAHWQAQALVARTRRDKSSSGKSFLLDMIHSDGNQNRQRAWQDNLLLAGLRVKGSGNQDVEAVAYGRSGSRDTKGLALKAAGSLGRWGLAGLWMNAESRLAIITADRSFESALIRLAVWQFRTKTTIWSKPSLPLKGRAAAVSFAARMNKMRVQANLLRALEQQTQPWKLELKFTLPRNMPAGWKWRLYYRMAGSADETEDPVPEINMRGDYKDILGLGFRLGREEHGFRRLLHMRIRGPARSTGLPVDMRLHLARSMGGESGDWINLYAGAGLQEWRYLDAPGSLVQLGLSREIGGLRIALALSFEWEEERARHQNGVILRLSYRR